MYTHRQYTIGVRDDAPRYGERPVPDEEFAGAGVLHDLTDAEASEMPLILARYATLRAWVMRADGERGPVAAHALIAAREYLLATDTEGDRTEAEILGTALAAGTTARALDLLTAAADAAASRGHDHGARAIRQVVHRARWSLDGLPPPSRS